MEVYGLFRKSNGRTVQGMIKMKRQLPYYIIVRSNGGIITGGTGTRIDDENINYNFGGVSILSAVNARWKAAVSLDVKR